jgi:hypothetical protein
MDWACILAFVVGMVDQELKTVSGWTMSSTSRQPEYHRLARIQNCRSAGCNRGRGCRRWRTMSCCRKHRFSATSSAFGFRSAAIAHAIHRITHPSRYCRRSGSVPFQPTREKFADEVFAPYKYLRSPFERCSPMTQTSSPGRCWAPMSRMRWGGPSATRTRLAAKRADRRPFVPLRQLIFCHRAVSRPRRTAQPRSGWRCGSALAGPEERRCRSRAATWS